MHLLTGVDLPKPDGETHLVAAALADLGARAEIVPWRGPGAGSQDADLALVRSAWDYTQRREEFVSWCRATNRSTPVHNAPRVIEWNSHKRYLIELHESGVPTLPTALVEAGARIRSVPGGWRHVVIKPAVSSGASGAGRFESADPAALTHLRTLVQRGDALVQPYAEAVATAGECSLIFLAGELSHAVNKVPADGDYRVQESRGGRVEPHRPTSAQVEIAHAALATVAADLVYARVDLVELAGEPRLIELELIEPELFLGAHPEAPERLARAVLERIPA